MTTLRLSPGAAAPRLDADFDVPGTVAITVGSRGIANITAITRAVAEWCKEQVRDRRSDDRTPARHCHWQTICKLHSV